MHEVESEAPKTPETETSLVPRRRGRPGGTTLLRIGPDPEWAAGKPHNPVDLAYAAGFFDGEGNISIQRVASRTKGGRDQFRVAVNTFNTNGAVLEALCAEFGSRVYRNKGASRPAHWTPSSQWQVQGPDIEPFIRSIRPYLRVKAAIADNVLDFIEVKKRSNAVNKTFTPDDLWQEMKQLHEKHRKLINTTRQQRTYGPETPLRKGRRRKQSDPETEPLLL